MKGFFIKNLSCLQNLLKEVVKPSKVLCAEIINHTQPFIHFAETSFNKVMSEEELVIVAIEDSNNKETNQPNKKRF